MQLLSFKQKWPIVSIFLGHARNKTQLFNLSRLRFVWYKLVLSSKKLPKRPS